MQSSDCSNDDCIMEFSPGKKNEYGDFMYEDDSYSSGTEISQMDYSEIEESSDFDSSCDEYYVKRKYYDKEGCNNKYFKYSKY